MIPFNDTGDTDRRAAIVCSHAALRQAPLAYAHRDDPLEPVDSGWQFLCDAPAHGDDELCVWAVDEVTELEPTLRPHVDAPPGTPLVRLLGESGWREADEKEDASMQKM